MMISIDINEAAGTQLEKIAAAKRWSRRATATVILEDALEMLRKDDYSPGEERIFAVSKEEEVPA